MWYSILEMKFDNMWIVIDVSAMSKNNNDRKCGSELWRLRTEANSYEAWSDKIWWVVE